MSKWNITLPIETFLKLTGTKAKIFYVLLYHLELNISEIKRELEKMGCRYTHRAIQQSVQSMDGIWLETRKEYHEIGKPVYIRLIEEEKKKAMAEMIE